MVQRSGSQHGYDVEIRPQNYAEFLFQVGSIVIKRRAHG